MRKVLIGTAAVAIATMTAAYSLPADAQGQGNGNGKGAEQAQQRGNGNGKKADRGPAKQDRGPQMQARGNGQGNGAAKRPDKVKGPGNGQANGQRPDRAGPQDARLDRVAERGGPPPQARGNGNGKAKSRPGNDGPFFARDDRDGNPGLIDGCPPGLAKKNNGCLPPGQAKKRDDRFGSNWFGLNGLSDDYRYRDGYMVRYGDNGIASYVPLLAGALSVGREWPGQFGQRQVPDYYRSYYNLGDSYRYYDRALYRLDPKTAAITSVAALITGDDITVGQPMPQGYDVYNVPLGYRDRYQDGADGYYRYSDGYIYRVDPKTRLVAAAIELLS